MIHQDATPRKCRSLFLLLVCVSCHAYRLHATAVLAHSMSCLVFAVCYASVPRCMSPYTDWIVPAPCRSTLRNVSQVTPAAGCLPLGHFLCAPGTPAVGCLHLAHAPCIILVLTTWGGRQGWLRTAPLRPGSHSKSPAGTHEYKLLVPQLHTRVQFSANSLSLHLALQAPCRVFFGCAGLHF